MSDDREAGRGGNPWPRWSWWFTAVVLIAAFFLGFVVLARYQQGGPTLDLWTAMCRAIGIRGEDRAAAAPQPPVHTPTRIAWTAVTLAQVGSANTQNGAFIALNCGGCHGDRGISQSSLIPTLAGMDAAVIYKQLDDYRSGKRSWGVMGAIASALSAQDSADVAAYFAALGNGLAPVAGEPLPHGGRSSRQRDPATRLVFAGDPQRGIPPCAACHGPGGHKLGAPPLQGQHAAYLGRQLLAFGQGMRRNDINQQMRVVAEQLAPEEVDAVSLFYSGRGRVPFQ
jgi:cytochrome c553